MKFLFGSGRLCLDFARTVRVRHGEAVEGLASAGELARWSVEARIAPPLEPNRLSPKNLEDARALREAIYKVIEARRVGRRPPAVAVKRIDAWAAHAPPTPRLIADGQRIVWSASDPFTAFQSLLARDAIDLAASPQIARVRECADEQCTSLFLDLSRAGCRRWCSEMPCANRHKVRNYRARRKAGPETSRSSS
jgi:predicted RNA-binding Zn ribbon-like protein